MSATDFLPQEGHYRKLNAFRLAECIYALTYDFAHKHLKAGTRKQVKTIVQFLGEP